MNLAILLLGALAIHLAQCQYGSTTISAYASVSPTPVFPSTDGVFSWPAGAGASAFTEGALMNVSWTTTWETVNLWLIINEQWDQPVSIASNYGELSFPWTVTCGSSCKDPFLFRAVDAQGSDSEQQHGGFYTRLFWIKSVSESSTSSTLTPVSTSGDLTPSATSTSTSASNSKTTNASTVPSATHTGNPRSSNDVAIGVGVGVGVGVALLAIGGFFLWRRYHRKMKEKYSRPQSEMTSNTGSWSWFDASPGNAKWAGSQQTHTEPARASTHPASPVEAPSWQLDPQELPAK